MKNEGLGMDHDDPSSHQCFRIIVSSCRVINLVLHAQKKSRMRDSG
jgi:hypothetical protein